MSPRCLFVSALLALTAAQASAASVYIERSNSWYPATACPPPPGYWGAPAFPVLGAPWGPGWYGFSTPVYPTLVTLAPAYSPLILSPAYQVRTPWLWRSGGGRRYAAPAADAGTRQPERLERSHPASEPGTGFYLEPRPATPTATGSSPADLVRSRLRVEETPEGFRVERLDGSTEQVEIQVLAPFGRLLDSALLDREPHRGMVQVPAEAVSVVVDLRNRDGSSVAVKLSAEAFRALAGRK